MDEIVTSDWSRFGYREIEMAKELLSNIKDIKNEYGKLEVHMNMNSGFVFISDEEYKTWMMNGDNIEEFFSCPICGHGGFLEDMDHGEDDGECREYLDEIKNR